MWPRQQRHLGPVETPHSRRATAGWHPSPAPAPSKLPGLCPYLSDSPELATEAAVRSCFHSRAPLGRAISVAVGKIIIIIILKKVWFPQGWGNWTFSIDPRPPQVSSNKDGLRTTDEWAGADAQDRATGRRSSGHREIDLCDSFCTLDSTPFKAEKYNPSL